MSESGMYNPIFDIIKQNIGMMEQNVGIMEQNKNLNDSINNQNQMNFDNFPNMTNMNMMSQNLMNMDFNECNKEMSCPYFIKVFQNYNNFKSFLSNEIKTRNDSLF